ncbi:MAG: hypothetical protein GY842_22970 [bacterium]|nr:hypothetical protein [bacterium]
MNGPGDRTIKPGQVEKLAVTLSSRKYSKEFTKKIRVTTNDPKHSQVTLTCKGKVKVPFVLKPRSLNFGQLSRATTEPQTRKVTITRGDAGPLKLELVPLSVKGLEFSLIEKTPGEEYVVEATLTPPMDKDQLRTALEIKTGFEKSPTAKITVYASRMRRVSAKPNRISVPQQRTSSWERSVRLIWDDTETHRITEAKVNDPNLTARIVDAAGGRQSVILTVPKDYVQRSGRRQLVIRTDAPDAGEVKVPITFRRQARSTASRKTRATGTSHPMHRPGSERGVTKKRAKPSPSTPQPPIPVAPEKTPAESE